MYKKETYKEAGWMNVSGASGQGPRTALAPELIEQLAADQIHSGDMEGTFVHVALKRR